MKNILLVSFILLFSGCNLNYYPNNIKIDDKCSISLKQNSNNTIYRANFNPSRATEFVAFGIKDRCEKVNFFSTSLKNRNHYYIYSANDDIKMYDKSCKTTIKDGINYSECDSGYYIDFSKKHYLGYKEKSIIHTNSKECIDSILKCEKLDTTQIDIESEYDNFIKKEILTQRYEKIREDRKIIPK
jgi:hypothetical protein